MYYTYILQSKKDGKYYTGATSNLRKRFIEHNRNEVSATKNRGPFILIYYEACVNIEDAFAREKFLKSGRGKYFLKNRIKRFLFLTGQVPKLVKKTDFNNSMEARPVPNRLPKATVARNRGYIALMATIVISLILLVMTVEEGSFGWYARFNVLGTEAKEQASALAEGCAEQAQATLLTDPTYTGDVDTTNDLGTCHVFPVQLNFPVTGLVTVKTQAIVRGSYANLDLAMNMNDIHFGSIPTTPTTGTLFITTLVINDSSGTKQAGDFTTNITANPSTSIAGSESGIPVTVQPGSYSITETLLPNYSISTTADCSGTITAGGLKFCTITNDDITTTLTVIANVVNDNLGTNQPADFQLFIDGNPVTLGQRVTVTAGTHTVSATNISPSVYAVSPWGYDCSTTGNVTMALGQNKTCIINYDDIPPPSPTCADTVMILDRTGSMSSTDRANEKIAANSLVSLYAGVLPPVPLPQLGVGSIGGLDGSAAQVPVLGQLTTTFNNLTTTINSMMNNTSSVGSDLFAGITAASNELNSSRHVVNPPPPATEKKKVIILVSDGDPNEPSGSITNNITLAPLSVGTNNAWIANTGSTTVAVTSNDGDTTYINPKVEAQTFALAPAGVPAGVTITSVTLHAMAKETSGTNGNIALMVESGSNQSVDGGHGLTSSYTDYNRTMTTNPLTGSAWTVAEVNAWTSKFGVLNASTGGTIPRVTQLYAVVNYGTANSSNLKSPTTAGSSSSDDWTNATRAFTSDNSYATETSDGDRQRYSNFAVNIPSGANVTGIEVAIEAKSSDSTGCEIDVDISPDGFNFTSNKTISLTGSDTIYTLGNSGDVWGNSWTASQVNSTNFTVRLEYVDTSSCTNNSTDSVDQVQTRVYYSTPGNSSNLAASAVGNYTAWTANTGTTQTAVASNDNDTTYIQNTGSSSASQSFLFSNATIPATASNISVTLHALTKETNGSNGNITLIAEKGGSTSSDGGHSLTSSYNDYSWTMNSNPFGGSWTIAEVNNWTTKFGLTNTSTGGTVPRTTQMYLVVSYKIVTDPVAAALNAADTAKLAGVDLFTIHFGSDPSGYSGRELLANLATGNTTVAGHQNGSLADAGGVASSDTGFIAPTTASTPNQWTNPTRALTSNNQYTTDNVNGHQQGFTTFGFNIPPTATINGVSVEVEAKSSDSSGCQVGAELSTNNGTNFTNAGSVAGVNNNDNTYTLGGSGSLWGRTWVPADFTDGKFVVRLQNVDPGNACVNGSTLSTDRIRARVYYTVNTENSDGDNFFVAPTSADMQDIFDFIGEQVCPASLNLAASAPPTTGILNVLTQVTNNNGGTKAASDFTVNVSAINPSQTTFPGNTTGVNITVSPGAYNVSENSMSGYAELLGATCSSAGSSGTISAGETRVCVVNNDDIPPPPPPPNLNLDTNTWHEVPTAN